MPPLLLPGADGEPEGAEVVADRLLNGRVVLRQSRRGHRAGTDAVLLSAMIPTAIEGLVVDVGAGTGAVGISIAVRAPGARLALIESEPAAAALARNNLAQNDLAERGHVFEVDLFQPKARRCAGLPDASAGVVVTNPPFFDAGAVRASSDDGRARAHVLPVPSAGAEAPLSAWIRACLVLLAPRGRFAMIHRPAKLATILAALEGRAGSVRVTPVHPYAGAQASRILVEGTKGNRGPTSIAPMLVLHEPGGAFTSRAAAIHRGEAVL